MKIDFISAQVLTLKDIFRRKPIAFIALFCVLSSFNIHAADVFVKGINMNGNALTIEGNSWISYTTALSNGFTTSSVNTFSNSITWSPATDTETNTMLNSLIYKSGGGSFTMNQTLTNGTYKVYFWLTENYADNARSVDIKLEGTIVASGVGKMSKNSWVKYGPYPVTVNDGVLTMDFVRISGDPQCSGLAIYSTNSANTQVVDAWSRIQAVNYNASSNTAIVKKNTSMSANASDKWLLYRNLDLHTGTNNLQMNIANGGEPTIVQLDIDGTVDTLYVENTGGWDKFQNKSFKLKNSYSGTKSIKFILGKNSLNIDWFAFSNFSPNLLNNRVIVLTDIGADQWSDPDDRQSMVRACLYSNEIDFEGLIHQTGCYKMTTDNSKLACIRDIVSAYGQVRSNLMVHGSGYPTVEYLLSIIKLGQTTYGMAGVGSGKDTDGSNLIINAVDKDDPRPVWISCWGGMSTLAQALWQVQNTRTPEQVDQFVNKLRVYDIGGQDDAGAWITHNFPNLIYICSIGQFYGMGTQGEASLCDANWLANNIQNHGLLGAQYPNVAWTMEGDSPSFIHLINNGLHNPMMLDQGGWGGRFNTTRTQNPRSTQNSGKVSTDQSKYDNYSMFTDASDNGNTQKPVFRWRLGYQNEVAAHMDWTLTSTFSGANHNPKAVVNNDTSKEILQLSVSAGTTINLNAIGSTDPDGNSLVYSWWYYDEPSTYDGTVSIQNSTTVSPTITIPSDASGKSIHIILELHDNGTPNLYAYRRVILNVK